MEQWALALLPGSLGGGPGSEKSPKSLFGVVMSALDPFRLWDEPLLDDGCERGSVPLAVCDGGSSSTG